MLSRRTFLASSSAAGLCAALASAQETSQAKKRMAVVTTLWNYRSHAWHMAERFLHGYPREGHWHRPPIDVVCAYVDQRPEGDLSRQAVGGVRLPDLHDGRRGPALRRRQAGRRCGAAHRRARRLSEERDSARSNIRGTSSSRRSPRSSARMAGRRRSSTTSTSRGISTGPRRWSTRPASMNFPFLAGSSLPVTWRMPAIDLPYGAEVEEIVCVAIGRDRHLRLPRPGDDRSAWPSGARGARRASSACTPCAATRCGRRWRPARGRRAAGTRGCSRPACPAARRWPRPRFTATAIRRRRRCASWVQGADRLPLRVRRRPEGDDAAA